jgi:ferredoxin
MNTVELYRQLAARLQYPNSPYVLRIVERMFTPEEGALLLQLPAPIDDLAQQLGLESDEVRVRLRRLLARGAVIATAKGLSFCPHIGVLHDTALSSEGAALNQEELDVWKAFYEGEWAAHIAEEFGMLNVPAHRVIPSVGSLHAFRDASPNEVTPGDDLEEIIAAAHLISVRACACRAMMRNCDHPVETCFQLDSAAEYDLSRPAGRRVSADEAIELLKRCESQGLVHTVENRWPNILTICNCCEDACVILNGGLKYDNLGRALAPSRFAARVAADRCDGCQECMERCNFGAVAMEKVVGSKKLKAHVDASRCFGCGLCVDTCESEALSLTVARPADYVPSPGGRSLRDTWTSAERYLA